MCSFYVYRVIVLLFVENYPLKQTLVHQSQPGASNTLE